MSEAYSKPCETPKMGIFVKIINSFQPLTIFPKSSILDIWQGSDNASNDTNNLFEEFIYFKHNL